MRSLFSFALCSVCLALAGCSADPAEQIRNAINGLEVKAGSVPGDNYQEAQETLRGATSPVELQVMVDHLRDDRPTALTQALATTDGSPVNYTIGDELLWQLQLRFVEASSGRVEARRQIEANPRLASKESVASWFREFDFDLERLRADHRQRTGR